MIWLKLTPEQVDKVLLTTNGWYEVLYEIEEQGFGADDLDNALLDHNVEQCERCDAYVESWEIHNNVCRNCRDDEEEGGDDADDS